MINLGIIFGGMSTEHDVSVVSGTSIIEHLNKEKYNITAIYIDVDGNWYIYNKNINEIVMLEVGDKINKSELIKIENPVEILKSFDKVFPVLHGLYGEDGTIQGMLELLKIPYVGCAVLASSICMDKVYTKAILEKAGIRQAKYSYLKKASNGEYILVDDFFNENKKTLKQICEEVVVKVGLPAFVKPSNSGSSVGIKKAKTLNELAEAIEYASRFDRKILVEEAINAREIECAVLGTDEVMASGLGEILPAEEFYDFDAKYKNSESKAIIPADIKEEVANEIQKIAITAYKAVDAKDMARVDFFIDKKDGTIYLNEINTIPGFTAISMYPQLWEKSGKTYEELLDELI